MSSPLVSVIIPCKNSARTLRQCLLSLGGQSYRNLEIIVADSNSKDGTPEIAAACSAVVLSFPESYERTLKKNEAARMSNGEYLYFVDSDIEVSPTVVEDCLRACSLGVSAVIVPFRFKGTESFWDKCRELEARTYDGDPLVSSPTFFLRSAFMACNGFDRRLVFGEENDLHLRLRKAGYRVGLVSSVFYHHEGRFTSVVRRKYYYGKTSIPYIAKQGVEGINRFSFIRLGWIRNRSQLMADPAHAAGLVLLKITEYLAAGIGLAVGIWHSSLGKASDGTGSGPVRRSGPRRH